MGGDQENPSGDRQEVPMDVQSNSNDLLVTVHASQDKKAAGRILWFNMGYEDVREIKTVTHWRLDDQL